MSTVNSVTTPTPTISAEAVPAVRRGLRRAFCRASAPVIPRSRGSGHPRSALAGRATVGPSMTMPMRVSTAPRPARMRTLLPLPMAAVTTTSTPSAASTIPAIARGVEALLRSIATSRRAASGATRDALMAGTTPASSVTTTPTRKAMAALVPVNARPLVGRANPISKAGPIGA